MKKLDGLLSNSKFTLMVIGSPDTGKSSFIKDKARHFSESNTAVVDLDPGQQSIGMPSTVAWCMAKDLACGRPNQPASFYFTGSTSPSANVGRHLTGSQLVCGKARQSADRLLIDTSGLVAWPIGTMMKLLKIELLNPDIVVAFEKDGELDELFMALRGSSRPMLFRFPASEKAVVRSQKERAGKRKEIFHNYFKRSNLVSMDIRDIGISESNLRFRDIPTLDKPQDWFENRMVGIRDKERIFIALGLVQSVSSSTGKLTLLTPHGGKQQIASIVFGQIRITPDGEQISYG